MSFSRLNILNLLFQQQKKENQYEIFYVYCENIQQKYAFHTSFSVSSFHFGKVFSIVLSLLMLSEVKPHIKTMNKNICIRKSRNPDCSGNIYYILYIVTVHISLQSSMNGYPVPSCYRAVFWGHDIVFMTCHTKMSILIFSLHIQHVYRIFSSRFPNTSAILNSTLQRNKN